MLERLAIRRDRHRESIRKEHRMNILQKMRLQMMSRQQSTNSPYLQMVQRIKDHQNQPYCAQLTTQILQFACQFNNDKSMIILGNYLIDYVPQGLLQAFDHLIGFWSESRCFPWIVRLVLQCSKDPTPYIKTIDRMVHNCQKTDAIFVVYTLKCVEFLVQNNHMSLILNDIASLPHLVKNLTKIEHFDSRRLANGVVLDMLTHYEPARQRLLSKLRVEQELVYILQDSSLGLLDRCLTAIQAVVFKSLEQFKSNELFSQLQVLYHCCSFKHQEIICKILQRMAQQSSANLFAIINAGLRNILGQKLDPHSFPADIIYGQLRLIDTIFKELSKLSESSALLLLKSRLEEANQLSDRLVSLLEMHDDRIGQLAQQILNNNYDFEQEESLMPQ